MSMSRNGFRISAGLANVVTQTESARGASVVKPVHRKSTKLAVLALLSLLLLGFAPHAFAFSSGQAASIVFGESSLASFNPRPTQTGLNSPFSTAFDSGGNLWVADYADGRVLQYAESGSAASSTTAASSTSAASTTSSGSSSNQSSSSSSTGGGGGVPEFPYQFAVAALFTALVVVTYLTVRRRKLPA